MATDKSTNAEALAENLGKKGVSKAVIDKVTSEGTGKEFTATQLSNELGGTIKQRLETERTVVVKMFPDHRQPEVVFTGFWNGKFIKGAQNAISREYRGRRHKRIGMKEQGDGDGR